ncbi:type II toxin-antitoxin system YoeB family toxin [Psychrosphaera algicola]
MQNINPHKNEKIRVGNLTGFWSRRIDDTSRLVCAIDDHALTIISCRYHY